MTGFQLVLQFCCTEHLEPERQNLLCRLPRKPAVLSFTLISVKQSLPGLEKVKNASKRFSPATEIAVSLQKEKENLCQFSFSMKQMLLSPKERMTLLETALRPKTQSRTSFLKSSKTSKASLLQQQTWPQIWTPLLNAASSSRLSLRIRQQKQRLQSG